MVIITSYKNQHELYHHGIKGMRWGVRRTKEQLSYQRKAQNEMLEALRTGKVSTKVNPENQSKHILGSKNYTVGRSFLLVKSVADAQKLINELSGTGSAVNSNYDQWIRKERVRSSRIIGVYIDHAGIPYKTKNAMIVYGKHGAHIYPRR